MSSGSASAAVSSSISTTDLHHVRHHIDVGLVQVPPDPSVIGTDVKVSFHPPTSICQRPSRQSSTSLLLVSAIGAIEVGEVEPVRDDPLERRIGFSDRSPV